MRSVVLLAGLALSAAACGSAAPAATRPVPAAMPVGGHFRGAYQGPYHMALNIWEQGNQASGTWRAVGGREGQFYGTIFGNLLVINWTEKAVGNAETWSGRGYFVYSVGEPGRPHQIYGEWGMGRSGRSSTWWAVKRAEEPSGARAQSAVEENADEPDEAPGCEMGNCDSQDTEAQ